MTKEFIAFENSARLFCAFIETENSISGKEFLLLTQQHLLALYASAKQIPFVDLQSDKDFDIDLPEDKMKSLLKLTLERVPFAYYWIVLNPIDKINLAETGTGDLVDDLGDIYKDLKSGLLIFELEDIAAKEKAIWKFKFDFDFHWGEHCIDSLYIIHHYLSANR